MELLDQNTELLAGTRAHCSAEREPSADLGRPLVELSRNPKKQLDLVFVSRVQRLHQIFAGENEPERRWADPESRLEPGLDHRRPGQLILWATPTTLLSSWVEKLRLKGSRSFQKVEKSW